MLELVETLADPSLMSQTSRALRPRSRPACRPTRDLDEEPTLVAPTLSENTRTRLIGQIAALLSEPAVPAETRDAGLALIGWLARRMPQDRAPACCAAVIARSRTTIGMHAPTRRAR